MKIILFLNILFVRLSSKFYTITGFLRNILYFCRYSKTFERGVYLINSRLIIKQDITDNEHFIKTTLSKWPKLYITKKSYSDPGARNMLGFHPDMYIHINFQTKVVSKSFLRSINLVNYEKRRRLLTDYISAPMFQVIDSKTYREELISGREFVLTESNKNKFHLLLLQYITMIESTGQLRATEAQGYLKNTSLKTKLENYLDIDINILELLLASQNITMSKGSDIAGPNIIESESKLLLIDWEPKELKYRLYWTDPINLIMKCDPNGLIRSQYQGYLIKLLQNCIPKSTIIENDRFLITLITASFIMNIPKLHQVDLVGKEAENTTTQINKLTKLDLEKIIRDVKRFYQNLKND